MKEHETIVEYMSWLHSDRDERRAASDVQAEDFVPMIRHLFENPPGKKDMYYNCTLITTAGTCIEIPTTVDLPEEYRYWVGVEREYWVKTNLDGTRIAAVNLLKQLSNGHPIDEKYNDCLLLPVEFPPPEKIKRSSMNLFAEVVPYGNAWRKFYILQQRKNRNDHMASLRAKTNLIAPIAMVLVIMLILGLEAMG